MFQHLSINGDAIQFDSRVLRLEAADPYCTRNLQRLRRVVYAALDAYRGSFPVESPTRPWGRWLRLPWRDEYYSDLDGIQRALVVPTNELERFVSTLSRLMDEEEGPPHCPVSYECPEIRNESRSLVQSLAIETLMCADRHLAQVLADNSPAAVAWLQLMYTALSDLTVLVLEHKRDLLLSSVGRPAASLTAEASDEQ